MSRSNPKTDVDLLGKAMLRQAHANKLRPSLRERFKIRAVRNSPSVRIRDTLMQRQVEVGLCDFQGAIAAINAFIM